MKRVEEGAGELVPDTQMREGVHVSRGYAKCSPLIENFLFRSATFVNRVS
jgi:hypothetical protein